MKKNGKAGSPDDVINELVEFGTNINRNYDFSKK